MTRVLIADDHEIVRRGLRDILTTRLGKVAVSEAKDAGEAINLLIKVAMLRTKPCPTANCRCCA